MPTSPPPYQPTGDDRTAPSMTPGALGGGARPGGSGVPADTMRSVSSDEPTWISSGTPAPSPPTTTAGGLAGTVIQGYQLIEEVHRGGQGVVYRAVQLGTKRQVALKLLLEGPFASEGTRRRFEREVELAASLRHPNVVTILDSGVSHGRYYFAAEYIEGLRLDRYLAKVRPPLRDTLQLFMTICNAVNFAHQRGVIHRDLKPPNILVDDDGQPHVLDFGLAKAIRQPAGDQSTIQVLSSAGELLGTVAYMSPEQTVGAADVDVRSDVYSLGVVFFEALLGHLPYSVEGPLAEVLNRIATADPIRPQALRRRSRFGPFINDELETILLKSLEKHPIRRYQTAGELARDLGHLLRGEPVEAKRASGLYMLRKTLRRYRVQASVAATILLTLLVSLVGLAFMWSAEREAGLRAEQHRSEAQKRAFEAREARDAAVRAEQNLRQALVQHTIQRGDLAQARGDLVAARDSYWDAHEQADTPATRWALRQYYLQTGDVGAGVLDPWGRNTTALSPDVRLAAVCETRDTITIRRVDTGYAIGWLRAAGPVLTLSIDDAGSVCAAGRGWARLWKAGSGVPLISAELSSDLTITSIHVASGGRRLVLVGPQRVVCLEGARGATVGTLEFRHQATGLAAFSQELDLLAIPTEVGIQRVRIDDRGNLQAELIGPEEARPRLVCFAGEKLVALGEGTVYIGTAATVTPRSWLRAAEISGDWQLFDVDHEGETLVFGARDGHVALMRRGEAEQAWRASGDLKSLRLLDDDKTVVTLDQRGTLTRWLSPRDRQAYRRIADRPPVAWAVADDGSSALLADARQRVVAYSPQRSRVSEEFSARRPFSLWPGRGSDDMELAVSALGKRAVIGTGNFLRLRDTEAGTTAAASWADPLVRVLRFVAVTGDGAVTAVCDQTPAEDRQQISFWHWQPGAQTERTAELTELLAPARAPVDFVGSVIRQMVFQPGSTRLLVARSNSDLLWLDAHAEAVARTGDAGPPPAPWLRLDAAPVALAFDRTGEQLAVACEDEVIRLLATRDGTLHGGIRIDNPVRTLAFGPGGNVLMVATADGAVALYELPGGERVAQLAQPGEDQPAFAAWIGDAESILLGSADGVHEHSYQVTDELIARNRAYARQRAVARLLANRNFEQAWAATAALCDVDAMLARNVRETMVDAALRRVGQEAPAAWIDVVIAGAAPTTLLRLGHAAYDGEHFDLARTWLHEGQARSPDGLDAYSALRVAQCDYLADDYEAAAAGFARALELPDLDTAYLPTVQLQQTAALVLADRLDDARAVTYHIGSPGRDSPRIDIMATTSAKDIARYLTGLESESPAAAFVERNVVPAVAAGMGAEGVLRFQDDGHFFQGELARRRGDNAEAAAQYQRCLDVARDTWPASWARFRLLRLSRTKP